MKEVIAIVRINMMNQTKQALTECGGDPVPEPEYYMEKPVEAEELAATIEKILG